MNRITVSRSKSTLIASSVNRSAGHGAAHGRSERWWIRPVERAARHEPHRGGNHRPYHPTTAPITQQQPQGHRAGHDDRQPPHEAPDSIARVRLVHRGPPHLVSPASVEGGPTLHDTAFWWSRSASSTASIRVLTAAISPRNRASTSPIWPVSSRRNFSPPIRASAAFHHPPERYHVVG